MPTRTRKQLGDRGETLAAEHLESAGWSVLARNFRMGHKEVDLIVRRGDLVAFVEVKARAGAGYGHPLEAVTRRKRQEIQQVAQSWILRFGRPEYSYRFDAVAIRMLPTGRVKLEHVEDAWRM